MSVRPLHDRIIIERIEEGEQRVGGIIIPDNAKERIFHPFFTTKNQGSGVGLSTVKKIVDSHGGLIDVDRSSMGGARFTVRLPMTTENRTTEGQQR